LKYLTDRFQFLSVIIIFVPWRCFVLLIAKELGINRAQTNYNAYCVAAHSSDTPDDVYIMEMYARNNTDMRYTRFVDWEKNEACFLIFGLPYSNCTSLLLLLFIINIIVQCIEFLPSTEKVEEQSWSPRHGSFDQWTSPPSFPSATVGGASNLFGRRHSSTTGMYHTVASNIDRFIQSIMLKVHILCKYSLTAILLFDGFHCFTTHILQLLYKKL